MLVCCSVAAIVLCAQPVFGMMFADKQTFKCPSNTTRTNTRQTIASPNSNKLFYSVLLVALVEMSFDAGVMGLVDAGCLHRVESTTDSDIGKQQYIGVIGTITTSNLIGIIIMYYPKSNTSCETGIIFVHFAILIGLGISSYFLFKGINMDGGDEKECTSTSALIGMLRSYDHHFFFACLLFVGIIQSFFFNYTYLYLKELKAIPLIYGMHGNMIAVTGGIVYYFFRRDYPSCWRKLKGNVFKLLCMVVSIILRVNAEKSLCHYCYRIVSWLVVFSLHHSFSPTCWRYKRAGYTGDDVWCTERVVLSTQYGHR